jgi:hypothetical protein
MTHIVLPLLAGPCPPHHRILCSRQDDQTAGAKDTVVCATAAAKVVDGNISQSMARSNATNTMGLVVWWRRGCNNIVVSASLMLSSSCRGNSILGGTMSCGSGGHGCVRYCCWQIRPHYRPLHNGIAIDLKTWWWRGHNKILVVSTMTTTTMININGTQCLYCSSINKH